MGTSLITILAEAFALFRRHGFGLYFDYLAAMIVLSTFGALANPDGLRARLTGTLPEGVDTLHELILFNPGSYASSVVFTLVSATAFLRIWWREEGYAPDPGERRAIFVANIMPLIVLQLAADLAFTLALYAFFIPAILVAALTMFLIPAVLLEDRGWSGLGRALGLAAPNLLRLSLAWFVIIFPWFVMLIIADPVSPAFADADVTTLWLSDILSDIWSPAFSAFSLCVVIAAYHQMTDPGRKDLENLFR